MIGNFFARASGDWCGGLCGGSPLTALVSAPPTASPVPQGILEEGAPGIIPLPMPPAQAVPGFWSGMISSADVPMREPTMSFRRRRKKALPTPNRGGDALLIPVPEAPVSGVFSQRSRKSFVPLFGFPSMAHMPICIIFASPLPKK